MKNKKIIFSAAAAGAVIMLLLFSYMLSGPHMMQQPKLRTFEQGMRNAPAASVPVEKYETVVNDTFYIPAALNESNLKRGQIYYNYYCVFCHGENGKGNGPVGKSYTPKPADLTSAGLSETGNKELVNRMIKGTGHDPVLNRVIPKEDYKYLLIYVRNGINGNRKKN